MAASGFLIESAEGKWARAKGPGEAWSWGPKEGASAFATLGEAQEALERARAEAAGRADAFARRLREAGERLWARDPGLRRLRASQARLEGACARDLSRKPAGPKGVWAVACEDGSWASLRSGKVGTELDFTLATLFASEAQAREAVEGSHWTKDAAPLRSGASVVSIALRPVAAKPLSEEPGARVNGWAGLWLASEEAREISREMDHQRRPAPEADSPEPIGPGEGAPRPARRARI